jgi:cystathionine gamma-synthase
MVSFYAKDARTIPSILKNVKLALFAESSGGVESLITYPSAQTRDAIPEETRLSTGVNEKLPLLSVGIENPCDIIADLSNALE